MKLTNFKMYTLMIVASALLALNGCDGTTGISSDSGITVAAPDAVESTVTANPVSVTADGIETATVTVTVNDENSNPVTDATVTLVQTGSSTISAVTNVGDGTYTFDVSSTIAETVTYTGTADGVTITQTADVTFTETEEQCLLAAGGYETVLINGRTWLDRNLGASAVADTPDNTAAFGDYYQWGRSTDGHQTITSDISYTLATTLDDSNVNTDWYGKFIVNDIDTPPDWVATTVDDDGSLRSQSWGTPYDENLNPNQVCPCGYIVPTSLDFANMNNTADFNAAYAGRRAAENGIIGENNHALFWTTTHSNNNSDYYFIIQFDSLGVVMNNGKRGAGVPIRCIKPLP